MRRVARAVRLLAALGATALAIAVSGCGEGNGKKAPAQPPPRTALIGLDGKRAGATRREIARVIYGDTAVAAQWSDPSETMKDRVKRSIKRGERLMNGGYRALLR